MVNLIADDCVHGADEGASPVRLWRVFSRYRALVQSVSGSLSACSTVNGGFSGRSSNPVSVMASSRAARYEAASTSGRVARRLGLSASRASISRRCVVIVVRQLGCGVRAGIAISARFDCEAHGVRCVPRSRSPPPRLASRFPRVEWLIGFARLSFMRSLRKHPLLEQSQLPICGRIALERSMAVAAIAYPFIWLMETLRQWRIRERQTSVEELMYRPPQRTCITNSTPPSGFSRPPADPTLWTGHAVRDTWKNYDDRRGCFRIRPPRQASATSISRPRPPDRICSARCCRLSSCVR